MAGYDTSRWHLHELWKDFQGSTGISEEDSGGTRESSQAVCRAQMQAGRSSVTEGLHQDTHEVRVWQRKLGQKSRVCVPALLLDRLRSSGRHEHRQYGGNIANVTRNRHQCFRYGRVLFRQSLKSCADTVKLIDFVQNRFKSHGCTAL